MQNRRGELFVVSFRIRENGQILDSMSENIYVESTDIKQ